MMPESASGELKRVRVLLVEDDEEDYVLTRELLEQIPGFPYELEWAESFEDGLDRLTRGTYDVCLLDYRLGARDGVEFLREARGSADRIPIISLTGTTDHEIDYRLMGAGASDFLAKARMDARLLDRSIRYSIEHKRAESAQRIQVEAGRALAASLDHDTILGVAARIAVPELADGSWVLIRDAGDGRRSTEAYHRDEECEALLLRLLELPFSVEDSRTVKLVMEEGTPRILSPVTPHLLESLMAGSEHRALLGELDPGSLVIVPIETLGRVLGVLVLMRSPGRRPFDARDLAVTHELGRSVAVALENARLFETAQEAIRARDEVLSMVSHDLGNPLAAVVMVAERLLDTIGPGEAPRVRSHVEMIQSSAESMVRMVRDLLEVGRAESGHFTIERRPESMGPLVERATRQFQEAAVKGGIALEAVVPEIALPVEADEVRMKQVLGNLLSNALKFTPPGGHVRVLVADGGEAVTVSVIDSGPGIDAEDLPHLFDRFWQARKTRRGGAGLGLTIAREIVSAHGGRIWAESTPGQGSAFHFTVPIAKRRATG